MTNFTWTVERLETTNLTNFENYVVNVVAKLKAEKEGFTADTLEFASFPIQEKEGLKPFSELTSEEVIAWVVESFPKQRVERMHKMLERQLDSIIEDAAKPKFEIKSVDLPWSN